jgi:hypothetical protein
MRARLEEALHSPGMKVVAVGSALVRISLVSKLSHWEIRVSAGGLA